ncbi:MAG: MFS transporter [Proteobacteria bacterium]|nr:MFS transporter [Pseudomonadota bacterium]MDA1309423.1 MFS transporter [Pseudomonadota bacterium]
MPITRMLMINVGHGLDHLLMLLFPVVAALAASAFDEDYGPLLALSTGSWLAFGLGSMPAGWLADRWSRRGMLAVFFIGSGAACLLTAAAQNYWQIAGALALLGLFASIYHPVGVAILAGGAAETLGKRLAINGVWGNVGVAFSAVVAGALADRFGWQAAFIVPGVASIGLGVLWLILVPAGAVEDGRGGSAKSGAPPPVDWKRVITIIACLTVLTGFAFNAAIVSVPKLLDERLGEFAGSATAVGFLAFGVYIVAGFAQLFVGGLIDRFPIKPIFLTIAAAEAVAMFLVINAEGMALMIAAAAMMALVYAGLPIADTLIGRNAPAHLRSRIYAFTYLISFGASTAAIPAIAYLHGNGGFAVLFAILAGMGVIVLGGVSLLPGHRPTAPAPAE